MTLRAVLFDAGNTLLFLEYDRLAREVGAALDLTIDAGALRRAAPDAARLLERGAGVTDRERASRYLEALFLFGGVAEARLGEVRDALLGMHAVRHLWSGVQRDTHDALRRLREMGILTGVVSNSDGRVAAALEAAGLLELLDVVIDSAEVGVEKPDPAIFAPALEALGIAPDETVYLGDIYEVDVVGARAAGIEPLLVDADGRHAERDVPVFGSVGAALAALERDGRLVPAAPAGLLP